MPKRILVLSAAVGAGHLRAAQAVELAIKQLDPSATVRNVDVLQLTNKAFQRIYGKAYLDLVNLAPHVLGLFYDLMDRPRSANSKRTWLRGAVEHLNLLKLSDMLEAGNWDVIVNTHFLPAEIIAQLRRRKKIRTPQITVTTDFATHRAWKHEPCDHYTTACEEGAEYLASFGIDRSIISVTGIPIHPLFAEPKDRGECLKRQHVKGDRPIVLQLAGGFGVGPIQKLYEAILSVKRPLDLIVVTGKNEKLRRDLSKVKVPSPHRAHVLGFTDQMDELLCIADLVISKPGGLTTSEVLARGSAMAIVNPIPGQESHNSDYLLENGAAIKINHLGTLPMKLNKLLSDESRLESLKANARRIARPRAAFDVAQIALNWPRA